MPEEEGHRGARGNFGKKKSDGSRSDLGVGVWIRVRVFQLFFAQPIVGDPTQKVNSHCRSNAGTKTPLKRGSSEWPGGIPRCRVLELRASPPPDQSTTDRLLSPLLKILSSFLEEIMRILGDKFGLIFSAWDEDTTWRRRRFERYKYVKHAGRTVERLMEKAIYSLLFFLVHRPRCRTPT
jgi:hypothetical protein